MSLKSIFKTQDKKLFCIDHLITCTQEHTSKVEDAVTEN